MAEKIKKGDFVRSQNLVGEFLLMVFRQCFSSIFFDISEVTKIVLPKVLQNFKKLYLLAQGTEPKWFPA